MIKLYPYSQLGTASYNWLKARYHFSFSSYYNPDRLNFGCLRVINDDIIKAKSGFDTHSHQNMEIITYVRSGAITHKDSNGNQGRTEAGDIQVMSAGSGISHSEFNLEDQETNLYQIWITPNKLNVKPRWDAKNFPKEFIKNKLRLLVSSDSRAPLLIHQEADIYGGKMSKNTEINHKIKNQIYVLASDGEFLIDDVTMKKGDGAEVTNQSTIKIKALQNSEILVIDVPSN